MRLMGEKVVREIPDVERVNVIWIEPLIHGSTHFNEGFGEQVLRVPILEHIELRHPCADHCDAPSQLSLFTHVNLLFTLSYRGIASVIEIRQLNNQNLG